MLSYQLYEEIWKRNLDDGPALEGKRVSGQNKKCIWNLSFRQVFNQESTVTCVLADLHTQCQKQEIWLIVKNTHWPIQGSTVGSLAWKQQLAKIRVPTHVQGRNLVNRVWKCMSYPLLSNKLCQKLNSVWQQTFTTPFCFCVSGIQEWAVWVVLAPKLSWDGIRLLARAAAIVGKPRVSLAVARDVRSSTLRSLPRLLSY